MNNKKVPQQIHLIIGQTDIKNETDILYQLYFEMPHAVSKFTMVNADATTKEQTEQSELKISEGLKINNVTELKYATFSC